MDNAESLREFYERKFNWIPENLAAEIGHFNIFRLEPYLEGKMKTVPYRRRDFYKIMLVKGPGTVHYADRINEVKKQALSFSNPLVPYKWDNLAPDTQGIYCIFNPHFFMNFGQIQQYEVFQPSGNHIFELMDKEVEAVELIFEKMEAEFSSEYKYKYDAIRALILELIHFGMKLQPAEIQQTQHGNASLRIASIFLELLERQFPIDETHQTIGIRSPSDFADQLNVHVNHLNRAVKEMTGKTTSQLIADRVLQESKILLKQSNWNVSEIAYGLGFNEVTHFNNFFKKHVNLSPTQFRKV
ncbi:helix-turn-helix transcriptional regulator [Algoriphagus sp. NF]|jgi:AraC-type DNA-binding domain-containing proteins|uniref:helix-turn-helix domain-containing protein n=1 Tax=Algoriphagus sp. NF TaxID=2992756 RepID=UPI001066308F|nr:response regulator transcription factor [Algoriphagus sp. NF]MDE0558484.1 helix-turn-helix transcriptional regulator [Algoriphagus sp. NF]